jgi:N-acetylmuramoyl-L-alanine amidase
MLLLIVVPLSAQHKAEVLLKFSKKENMMRIVFEGKESIINNLKITTSPFQIKAEFPEPFNLITQKDMPFEVVPTDKVLVINLKEQSEIKFFGLSSPPRLVFDIRTNEKPLASILSNVFVIDAGHGGYDFGITYGNVSEKDISLSLAKDLGMILSKKGKKVFLTRKVDQYSSLSDRINFVNQKKPDVFISIHFSLSKNIVLYSPKFEEQVPNELLDSYSLSSIQRRYIGKSKALSDNIGKSIKDEFKTDVVYAEMPLPLLNSVGAPCVLIELPSPRFVVYDQQMRSKIVDLIIKGITLYGRGMI